MTDQMTQKLKSYKLEADEGRMKEVILRGAEQLEAQSVRKRSYLDLFLFTLRFIKWQTWAAQFLVFFFTLVLVLNNPRATAVEDLMKNLTGLLALSVLFFADEVFKSFTSGMWELEQTFRYDVRQHTLIKLLIFGLLDWLLIAVMSFLAQAQAAIPLLNSLLYLLVPYNLMCIALLYFLTVWRNRISYRGLWLTSGLLGMSLFVGVNLFNIYRIALVYWAGAFILTVLVLLYLLIFHQRIAGGMTDGITG